MSAADLEAQKSAQPYGIRFNFGYIDNAGASTASKCNSGTATANATTAGSSDADEEDTNCFLEFIRRLLCLVLMVGLVLGVAYGVTKLGIFLYNKTIVSHANVAVHHAARVTTVAAMRDMIS